MKESDFIDAINADPDDRTLQLIYADWLDGLDDPRAEAWRVLVEAGKRPAGDVSYLLPNGGFHNFPGWQWFPRFVRSHNSEDAWMEYAPHAVVERELWNIMPFFRFDSFFKTFNVAAIAWVRANRDEEFMRESEVVG
jgi:uncharacterized protein (TIGR02996 family)